MVGCFSPAGGDLGAACTKNRGERKSCNVLGTPPLRARVLAKSAIRGLSLSLDTVVVGFF